MQCEWSHNAQWQLVILELRNNVINVYIVKKKKPNKKKNCILC